MTNTTPQKALQDVIALGELATPGEWRVVAGDDYMIESDGYPESFPHKFPQDDLGPFLAYVGNRSSDFGEADAQFIVAAVNFIRQHGQHFAGLAENYQQRDADALVFESRWKRAETERNTLERNLADAMSTVALMDKEAVAAEAKYKEAVDKYAAAVDLQHLLIDANEKLRQRAEQAESELAKERKPQEVMSSNAYNLHDMVSAALPNNGEWHQLSSIVRNIDGVFQCAELLIRRFPGEASMASGVNTDIHLQALDDMAKSKQVTLLPAGAAELATIRTLQQQLAAARDWRFDVCERLGMSCAAGAEWTPVQVMEHFWNVHAAMSQRMDIAEAEAKRCREAMQALEADARRYRFLRDSKPNALHLTRNGDHACNYMTAAQWIEETPEWFADDPPEEIERMKAADTIWALQVYPDTPIGFYKWNAATLDAAIDAAIDATLQRDRQL